MNLNVRVHREDGTLWAEIPELPGCFASGETDAELVEAIQEAVGLYLSSPSGGPVTAMMTSIQLRTLQVA